MLHMKWLALHHCLWEWSSGEALGSLGQPLWFVLMFWFHNPNILRAVICSLFPFYSVILLLFFTRAKLSTERRSSFKWETEKGWRRRRRKTGRRELDGGKELIVKQHKQDPLSSVSTASPVHPTCPSTSSWVYICPCVCRNKTDERLKTYWILHPSLAFWHALLLLIIQTVRCTSVQTVWGLSRPLVRQRPPCGWHTATCHYCWLRLALLKRLV